MSDQPTNDDLARKAIAGGIPAFGVVNNSTGRLAREVAADAEPVAAEM